MSSRLILARHLFDGIEPPIEHGAVLVADGYIASVGPRASVESPPDAEIIDLGERSVLPGLIDAHLHLQGHHADTPDWPNSALEAIRAVAEAGRVLATGFTTVRDCGSANGVALRTAIEEGSILGPRILAAGPPISQTGGHADAHTVPYDLMPRLADQRIVADGVDACRQAARRVLRTGADLVKICTTGGVGSVRDHMLDEHFTVAEIGAIVDEAHRVGRKVAAHAQGKSGVLNAVRAGVDTIEHGYFIDDECIEAMLHHGTGLVPTFGLIRFFRGGLEDADGLPAWRIEKQRQCIDAMARSFPLAASAGVPIATGSDSYGIRGRELGTSAEELVAMVQDGGIDALTVLRYATSSGARLLGLEGKVGVLAVGAVADIVAVDGRPWERIEAIRDVAMVMTRGSIVTVPPTA